MPGITQSLLPFLEAALRSVGADPTFGIQQLIRTVFGALGIPF